MNTQNVNVKTATKESTERWVENLLATAISEQKSLLLYLVELKSKRMRESERSELVWGTLMRMADNVLGREWLTGTRTFCRCISALLNRGFSPGNSLSFFMVMLVRMRGMTHANTLLTQCALNPYAMNLLFYPTSGGPGPPVIHIRRDV
jgi:hypothetical protein